MSRFAERIGTDIAQWQSYVHGLLVTDQDVFGARLDESQDAVRAAGYQVSWGPEIEFYLEPDEPSVAVPNADEFYDEFVQEVCAGDIPLFGVPKGTILNPFQRAAPLILGEKRAGTYHWENGWLEAFYKGVRMRQIMEARVYPSIDWREIERRRWLVMGTAGSLAAKYSCRAKIVSTHERMVLNLIEGGYVYPADLAFDSVDLLCAIQGARSILQPLEAYSGIYWYNCETYPSKAAQWALSTYDVEGRFPLFAIPDTRLHKLGVFAGVKRFLEGKEPWGQGQLRRCQKVESHLPGLYPLFELMLWDKTLGQMVLPQNMRRSNILAAHGSHEELKEFDRLTDMFRGGRGADFSENDAQVLRQAVSELYLWGGELSYDPLGQFKQAWRRLFEFQPRVFVHTKETVRIAHPPLPAGKLTPYAEARSQAASSPDVAEILGPDVLRVLTPLAQAHNARARLVRTWAPPKSNTGQ